MTARISQRQADDAAALAASFWPQFGRRWPWTRTPDFAAVYQLAGEQTVILLRAFPAIQWSNQARWYQREVRETPAIIALTPEALRDEARTIAPNATPQSTEGKHVISLIYLPDANTSPQSPFAPDGPDGPHAADSPVAKTLLASTALAAPYYTAQLAHELLNCFCHTDWDGRLIRSGLRKIVSGQSPQVEHGAALNDLLLDAMLVHYLPAAGVVSESELFDGAQGPYWRIARTVSRRLRGVPTLPALFSGEPDALDRFERGLAVALDARDAAEQLDTLASAHDWEALRRLVGADD
jgi:hypothetical protein